MGACAEASFELAQDSPLPKWFEQAAGGQPRDHLTVTIDSYAVGGRKSVFKLWDSHGHKIAQATAIDEGLEPLTLTGHRSVHGGYDKDSFPLYELSPVGDVTEVIEQKKMEPWLYVNRDPLVRVQLLELVNKRPVESTRPGPPN